MNKNQVQLINGNDLKSYLMRVRDDMVSFCRLNHKYCDQRSLQVLFDSLIEHIDVFEIKNDEF